MIVITFEIIIIIKIKIAVTKKLNFTAKDNLNVNTNIMFIVMVNSTSSLIPDNSAFHPN